MTIPPITRILLAALLVSTSAPAGTHTERVHFAKGANSATIEGRIQGDMTIDYVLGARKGQSMNVSMATDNGANYFNIIAPGKENEAMFVGSSSGNQFEGRLPANGDYKVRVYLMRSAAREGRGMGSAQRNPSGNRANACRSSDRSDREHRRLQFQPLGQLAESCI
jgi:hypothetical protein